MGQVRFLRTKSYDKGFFHRKRHVKLQRCVMCRSTVTCYYILNVVTANRQRDSLQLLVKRLFYILSAIFSF